MRHLVLISIDLPEVYWGQNRIAAFSLLPLEEVQYRLCLMWASALSYCELVQGVGAKWRRLYAERHLKRTLS